MKGAHSWMYFSVSCLSHVLCETADLRVSLGWLGTQGFFVCPLVFKSKLFKHIRSETIFWHLKCLFTDRWWHLQWSIDLETKKNKADTDTYHATATLTKNKKNSPNSQSQGLYPVDNDCRVARAWIVNISGERRRASCFFYPLHRNIELLCSFKKGYSIVSYQLLSMPRICSYKLYYELL